MLALSACLILPGTAFASTYWISPAGQAAWTACRSDTPLDGTACCSRSTANTNAAAGDTVYFRGGTYSVDGAYGTGIEPTHSGSSGKLITFAAAPGETPVITKGTGADGWGVLLRNISYFKLDGFTIRNWPRWATLQHFSHHNEITNCTFYGDTGNEGWQGLYIIEDCIGGESFLCPSTHNWIHHNTLHTLHTDTVPNTCVEGADLIRIGEGNGTGDSVEGNNYNTIENNLLYHAGHTTFDGYGLYTVFRNNIMHNEPWWSSTGSGCRYADIGHDNPAYDGKYGHRTFQITDGYKRDGIYALVEGNRSGFGSNNPGNNGAIGMDIAGPRVIFRYNDIFGAMNSCLEFKYGWVEGAGGHGGTYVKAYNNTLYHCGYGFGAYYEYVQPGQTTSPEALLAVQFYQTETINNVLKNNLIYDSRRYALSGFDIGYGGSDSRVPAGTVLTNNWITSNGDPKFVNPNLTDPSSTTLPNLTLQSSSGAIDGGTYLTQANGSGTISTTLIVNDAMYFQDGTWGSDLAKGITLFPDWIAIGSVDNVVQISSINYSTNTITLASPMTWNNNAPIWLYKKSDGARVLYGSAPDYGASEFETGTLTPPGKPHLVR